jgi:hypothetical protein
MGGNDADATSCLLCGYVALARTEQEAERYPW